MKLKKKNLLKLIIYTILTFGCIITIFLFSAQNAEVSSRNSFGVLNAITEIISDVFHVSVDKRQILSVHSIFRKMAHFSIYAVLAVFAYNMFRQLIEKKIRIFIVTFIFCVLTAISDEIHQVFIPGRSAEVRDVLIDAFGVCVGLIFVWVGSILIKRRRQIKNNKIRVIKNV